MQNLGWSSACWTTLARNREELGETVTEWLKKHPHCEIVDMQVVQSSDREFHCISIILFFNEPVA